VSGAGVSEFRVSGFKFRFSGLFFAAVPPDVWKVCDLPIASRFFWGYAPMPKTWA
jgi:hypothetical protein